MLLLSAIITPLCSFGDDGIATTVDNGGYRFTVLCRYEPSQCGIVRKVENIGDVAPDTLSLPSFVVMYNDTFPVTKIDISRWGSGFIGPSVLDLRSIKNPGKTTSCLFSEQELKEIIFSEDTDSMLFSVSYSNISKINLDNIAFIRHRAFANTPELRELTLGPKVDRILSECFMGSGIKRLRGEGVTSILDHAFERSMIESVELPSLGSIGYAAFHLCPKLQEISLNPRIKSTEANAFNGTPLKSLNLHNAAVNYSRPMLTPRPEIYAPWSSALPDTMADLMEIKSARLKYLPFVNPGMVIDCPELEAIVYDTYNGAAITSFPTLKQLVLTDCLVDSLVIPDSLLNGIAIHRDGPDISMFQWYALKSTGSAVDKLKIGGNNTSYLVKDSILLSLSPEWPTDIPYPTLLAGFRVELTDILSGDNVGLRGYHNSNPDYAPSIDTLAVAAVGFPRGEWFTPKNNRWGGVTWCCDYVDKILITPDFNPEGYTLRTYTRPETDRIKVFVGTPTSESKTLLDCCPSPLMDFIVPKGMLGRYIASGLPADRTYEDTDGVLGIDGVDADPAADARRGIFTIDGRRISDGSTLAPGIYIIDGRKHLVR